MPNPPGAQRRARVSHKAGVQGRGTGWGQAVAQAVPPPRLQWHRCGERRWLPGHQPGSSECWGWYAHQPSPNSDLWFLELGLKDTKSKAGRFSLVVLTEIPCFI